MLFGDVAGFICENFKEHTTSHFECEVWKYKFFSRLGAEATTALWMDWKCAAIFEGVFTKTTKDDF